MDEVEVVARAIDPDAWADDVPTPTRGHVLDFHERRQRSCKTARAAIAALDACRKPLNVVGNVAYRKAEPIDPADWNPDEGSGVFWPAPKKITHNPYRTGREAGLREAAAWMKANAPVGMMEGDDYEREILALIDAKERVSANE